MDDSRQIERDAAGWLVRLHADDWDEGQRETLDAWLSANTRHRVAFLRLHAAWRETGRLQALAAGSHGGGVPERRSGTAPGSGPTTTSAATAPTCPPDLGNLTFAARPASPSRRGAWRHALAASVATIAVGLAAWAGWQLTGRHESSVASSMGQVQTFTLADGSVATLSSDSRVHVRFTRGRRDVTLVSGEAYFDVARDTRRPFVVKADGRRVAAVGTRFSVRRDAQALRVVVTEGKVRLDAHPSADGRASPVSLLPAGSVATASRAGVLVQSMPVAEAERFLEWRSGFLTFNDATLAVAANEFNRFNRRKLELGDPEVARLHVGGNFRWSNLDAFVTLLELGFPVRAERLPDRIVLHSD